MNRAKCIHMIPIVVLCMIAACGDSDRVADLADNASDLNSRAFYHNDEAFNRTPADFRAVCGFLTGTSLGPVYSYAYDIVINRDIADTIYMELGVFGVGVDPIARAVPFDASVDELKDIVDMWDNEKMLDEILFFLSKRLNSLY